MLVFLIQFTKHKLYIYIDIEAAQMAEIAVILGGGNVIRNVRRSENHTYVAFWTVHGAMEGMEYSCQKLERAGYACSNIQRARWKEDLHSHEFDTTPMYQDWGSATRRRITKSATSEEVSTCSTASVLMKPQKKRTRRNPRASGDMSESS